VRPHLPLTCALVLAGALAAAQQAPPPQDTYVRAGVLYTGPEVLEDVVIQVREGKVVALLSGEGLELPPGAKVVDHSQRVVAPGFVLTEWTVGSGKRAEETLSARFRALDEWDPYEDHARLLARGITTAYLHPGYGRLATGEGAVVKLAGPAEARVLRERAELCLSAGERALGPPPQVKIPFPSSSDVPIEPGKLQRPGSRSSLVPELAAQLRAALAYDLARKQQGGGARPALDLDLQALANAVLKGQLRIDARRAGTLRALLTLLRELDLSVTLSGVTEAHRVLGPLAELGAPVVFELPHGLRGRPRDLGEGQDRIEARWSTPARLARAGVRFAFAPPSGSALDLRLLAGLSVRGGLSPRQALAAITYRAAEVIGVGKQIGRIAPGFDADFVVLSGAPLATATDVLETWVAGEQVYTSDELTDTQAVVVRAGKIVTGAGPVIHDGAILIQDGAIAAIGTSVPHPRGARVIDAGPDAVVTPGFIDAYGSLGRGQGRAKSSMKHAFAAERESMLRVARAGVTTALSGDRPSSAGAPLIALKTAENQPLSADLRRGLVLREESVLAFDLTRADPVKLPSSFLGKIKAGMAHAKAWAQHRKKLEAFKQAQAKKKESERAADLKRRSARQPAPKVEKKKEEQKEEKKDDEPERKETKKFDPISGQWEFTITFGPRSQKGTMLLRLEDGGKISGVAKPPAGVSADDAPITGQLDGKDVTLQLQSNPNVPFKLTIKATLTGEDSMSGEVLVGNRFRLKFEATRTERSVPEIKIEYRRSKKKGGEPEPPQATPGVEAMRRAIEGEGAVLVQVAHPRVALEALETLRKAGVQQVVFIDFSDADLVAEALREAGAGVLVSPGATVKRGERTVSLAADLAGRGLRLIYASRAADGAAELPLRAMLDVADGLDPAQALAALTSDAARLLGIGDRVGTLEVGKDGDLLVFSGAPFEATSQLRHVLVRGRLVPTEEE